MVLCYTSFYPFATDLLRVMLFRDVLAEQIGSRRYFVVLQLRFTWILQISSKYFKMKRQSAKGDILRNNNNNNNNNGYSVIEELKSPLCYYSTFNCLTKTAVFISSSTNKASL